MLPDLYPSQVFHDQKVPASHPGMSLQDFMERTSLYEQMPVPFPSRLRRAAWTGMVMTLISSLILVLLPFFAAYLIHMQFPLFLSSLHGLRDGYVHWLLTNPLIRYSNGALIGSAVVLLILTCNLHQGRIGQQWVAFTQAIGGCINFLLIVAVLLFILLDLFMWILAFCILVLIVAIVLGVAFAFLR